MKKLLLGSLALFALAGASSALAADMRVKAPVYKAPPPVVVYSWTGCYIGGNAGGAWHLFDNTLSVTNGVPGYFNPASIPGVVASGTGTLESSGFIGGGQIGCNYQSGSVVWGVETDFNWMRQDAHYGGRFLYTTNGAPYFLNVSDEKHWLWTLRGRVGYAVDRVLFYVTGGFAAIRIDFTQTFSEPPFTLGPQIASFSKTKGGWTVGGGAEAGVWGNWTIKAEYLYAQFGAETVSGTIIGCTVADPCFAPISNSLSNFHLHVARVGLNYKFDWGGPVYAKY